MRIWGALVAAGGLLLVGPTAAAPPSPPAVDGVSAEIADQRRTLAEARRQAREASARAQQLEREATRMRDRAERDRAELAALALSIQSAEAELAGSRARTRILAGLAEQQRERLAAQQRPVAELMASLQLLTRRPPLSLFAQPGSARDLVHTRAMIDAVLPEMRRRTASLRAEVGRSRRIADQRRLAETRLEESTRGLADRRAQLARGEAERRLRATALAGSAGLEGDRALALGEAAGDIGVLLERLEDAGSVRDRLARLSGPVPRPGSVAVDARASAPREPAAMPAYRLPVMGRVVEGFGEVTGEGVHSRGITIAAAPGAQVVAPAAGRIVYAGAFRSYGRIVIVDHGGGWTSLITDMVAISAQVGERVEQGTPLGRTGPDRPRVTIELRRAGQAVDLARLAS